MQQYSTLATTRKKNEKHRDAKINAELLTKWTKKTGKTCEETIRRKLNRSIKASLVTDDDDDDDNDDNDDAELQIKIKEINKDFLV